MGTAFALDLHRDKHAPDPKPRSLNKPPLFIAQISSDREMYVEEDDMPSRARTSGLCEELGQVNLTSPKP